MQNHLFDSVAEIVKERGNDITKWRKLDTARITEMMIEYYFDNYCTNGEAPIYLTEENTGLGLPGIKCSKAWELFC